MLTDDKNLIEIYQDYIDEEGYVQRYNYDKGRYYNTGTCLRGPKGNCGNPGRPGKDGLTPRINQDNGHWMIGDVDTGVMAVGGQSDWNQNDNTKLDYIKNKPTISSGSVILNDSYGAFDLSVHNAVNGVPTTYANLSAALTALNALDSTYKKPGMSFRFVRSSDNKYVRYNLKTTSFSTTVTDWEIDNDTSDCEKITDIVAPVDTTDPTDPITTLSCEAGKYYRVDVPVETLAITLPLISDNSKVQTVVIYLTGGTTPAVTISGTTPSGGTAPAIYYQDGFEIEAGSTYEINALFNGAAWIAAAVKINVV